MWSTKNIKKQARTSLRQNYWRAVGVCLLALFLMGSLSFNLLHQRLSVFNADMKEDQQAAQQVPFGSINRFEGKSNSEIVNEFLNGGEVQSDEAFLNQHPTRGVLAQFFNNVTESNSFAFGILNALNQLLFHDRIGAGIIIFLGAILGLLLWLFLSNVIVVGKARFYLENHRCYNTRIGRLLFPFQVRRTRRTAWTMLMKSVWLFLWNLTIVGGFIKRYSYLMIPYILAENPNIRRREAFALSRSMMKGEKWHTFLLDLTFLGWLILGTLTLGITDILYTLPYRDAVYAELYLRLREKAKETNLPHADLLCDARLAAPPAHTVYPAGEYLIPAAAHRRFLTISYERKYTILSLILLFFTFSIMGWLWEVSLHLFGEGRMVNRGVMLGPWLPIYGSGGVLILVLLQKVRKYPLVTFFLTVLICGVVEYTTSWFLETTQHMKWWDYTGYLLNLNGRICLEGLIVFGFGGCAFIYVLAPLLDELYQKIPRRIAAAVCAVLLVLFGTDLIYSRFHPNTGDGITYTTSADQACVPPRTPVPSLRIFEF